MFEKNEISFKELVLILFSEKKLIAIITAVFTILAIVVTLLLPKTYQTQSQIVFNLPMKHESRFGTFDFPSQNIVDYLSFLTSDEVKSEVAAKLEIDTKIVNVQVIFDKENKFVDVKTTASTPELAKQINDTLVITYINRIRAQYKLETINKFIVIHENGIRNNAFYIERTQSMLTEKQSFLMELNPKYTLRKALFSDPETAALYADMFNLDLSTLSNDVILEEYASLKYLEIEAEVISLKSSLISMSEILKFSEKLLIELNLEKDKMLLGLESNNYDSILNDELDVLNTFINQGSEASVPKNRISPRNGQNVAIGFAFGLIVAMIFIFLKYYWKSEIK